MENPPHGHEVGFVVLCAERSRHLLWGRPPPVAGCDGAFSAHCSESCNSAVAPSQHPRDAFTSRSTRRNVQMALFGKRRQRVFSRLESNQERRDSNVTADQGDL